MAKQKSFDLKKYQLPQGKVLVLRTCDENYTSYGGFQWPKSGYVCAPDWKPVKECGNGLHGFMKGEGDGSLAAWDEKAVWLVCEVEENLLINLNGKVKFPHCEVLFSGDRVTACAIVKTAHPEAAVIGGTATAGNRGTATAGDSGTATAGDSGTATAGYCGTATAGYCGTATAGDSGTATAGYCGTATAGDSGTATAGDSGILIINYYDYEKSCYVRKIALVGENGIKPNVKYKLNDDHSFVECEG